MTTTELLQKSATELIGTAILVFVIQVSVVNGSDLAALAIGGILIAIVFAGGPVSGAAYNPAISLAVALRGKQPWMEMVVYIIVQLIGGIVGAALGRGVCPDVAVVAKSDDVSTAQALGAEVIFTFVLCYVVLFTATNYKVQNNHYYGMAIGLVVLAGAISVGPISGGAFNPAVVLGLNIAAGGANIGYAFAVAAMNLCGGVIAAACAILVLPKKKEEGEGDDKEASPGFPERSSTLDEALLS